MNQKLIFKSRFKVFREQCRTMCKIRPSKDMIGPPDPISNFRYIKYAIRENETSAEKHLRKCREELQAWNKAFWTEHNLSFMRKKKEFEMQRKRSDNQPLSGDEMSVFYKEFLDANWKTHLRYLFEWYKKNIFVTFLHLRVNIQKMFKKGS